MYSLNLTTAKKSVSLLLCLTLFACSSTEQVSNNQLSDNGYTQGYVDTNFSHSQCTPISKGSLKKPLNSDHQLMMSLLNRPMTADQAMMLAFAQERENYANTFANYANNGVMIKGDKASDNSSNRTIHAYTQQIDQDINAVLISGSQ
ncbi:hypothetical protein [Candidatus Colwellia aromaticivorans]|uniref:hypothetical protein n=1 Tax=Candidatus Colwellia aromaticivorans TaxID=2267621 RepID=UPI000DF2E8FD|nr:hypothetical protein [Candidatus Colwellia aromaticivorans]